MSPKSIYVNTVRASLVFVFFLTSGFVWASFYPEAPFTAYMEGLVIALGLISGKRLMEKWQGKTNGFRQDRPTQKPTAKPEACVGEEER